MQTINADNINPKPRAVRAAELFQSAENKVHQRADRMFAILMVIQWLGGIAAALWISPRTWIGATSQTHLHVWAAIFLGGAITSLPVYLALKQPGRILTRHTIAIAQMTFSALFIHLTGGRLETHFHVFGSLAFLAFYRDWRVLVSGTVVVAMDHFLRGTFWPQSVFGVLTASPWRWVEHAGWVLFEDTFLIISIRHSLSDMLGLAERQASLETVNADIERTVADRTFKLTQEIAERKKAEEALHESQALYHSLVEQLPAGVFRKDAEGRFVFTNLWFCRLKNLTTEQMLGKTAQELAAYELQNHNPENSSETPESRLATQGENHHELIMQDGKQIEVEERYDNPNGTPRFLHVVKTPVHDAGGKVVGSQGILLDITAIKEAEEKLSQVHKQLLDASRQAGMAEVATSVLHNVGNVLNSVNVSSSLIAEKMRDSKVANITKSITLIRAHENDLGNYFTNDPKGKLLPNYLANLAANLAQEQADILQEVSSLVSNIVHIKEIVSMQQSYAKASGVLESLQVTELVEDAIRMNNGAMNRHQVTVVREFADVPPILTEKHKVLQILVNLIRNAKYACDDSGRTDKQITLRVFNGDGRIKISVIDNGVGVPQENLTRIFGHGFTTRKEGHGFGLHSGALAAKELGGALYVVSEGHNRGANFTLELPAKQKKSDL